MKRRRYYFQPPQRRCRSPLDSIPSLTSVDRLAESLSGCAYRMPSLGRMEEAMEFFVEQSTILLQNIGWRHNVVITNDLKTGTPYIVLLWMDGVGSDILVVLQRIIRQRFGGKRCESRKVEEDRVSDAREEWIRTVRAEQHASRY